MGWGLHRDGDEQITRRTTVLAGTALTPEGDGLTVVDARRDGDGQLFLPPHAARAIAGLTGLVNDFSGTPALGAGGGGGEGKATATSLDANCATAVAVRADLRRGAGGASGAVADVALFGAAHRDLLLAAEGRLLEGDGDPCTDGLPLLGAIPAAGAASAKASAEEGAEEVAQVDVAHIRKAAEAASEPAARIEVGVHARMSELVITGAFFLVGQDLVGLVDLLEPGLGRLVARVQVRVVLFGQFPVGLFDLIVRGAL